MKKILMIATGGTIASKPTESGLAPQMNAEEILRCVPSLRGRCIVETLQLMNIDEHVPSLLAEDRVLCGNTLCRV